MPRRAAKQIDIAEPYVRACELVLPPDYQDYPAQLPSIRALRRLELHPRVTFLVGDNGSGKSTLLEAMAVALRINPQGGSNNMRFRTLHTESSLGRWMRIEHGRRRCRHAFFFRAETMFSLFEAAAADEAAVKADIAAGAHPYEGWGNRWLGLELRSHGESHFDLFTERLSDGLYILDEPEAALSVHRQMSLLTRIHDMVAAGAQLVIATHSPIILAYPDATIYDLTANGIQHIPYEACAPYRMMHRFITDRARVLAHLLE